MKNITSKLKSLSLVKKLSIVLLCLFFIAVLSSTVLLINTKQVVSNNKAATLSSTYGNTHIKYFGYYTGGTLQNNFYNDELSAFGNTNFAIFNNRYTVAEERAILQKCKDLNMKCNIHVLENFFWIKSTTIIGGPAAELYTTDLSANMNFFKQVISGYEDQVYSFYFDEPALAGVREKDFRYVTKALRETFPNINIMAIEGIPALDPPANNMPGVAAVNPAFYEYTTDIGFDYYNFSILNNNSDWMKYYNKLLTLGSNKQNFWLATDGRVCNSADTTKILNTFNQYYDFAQNNSRVIGILNYSYEDVTNNPGNSVCPTTYSLKQMYDPSSPVYNLSLKNRQIQVGRDILANKKYPTATITGTTVSYVNKETTFTATVKDQEGKLGFLENGKKVAGKIAVKPIDNSADWVEIKSATVTEDCNNNTFTCTFTGKWTPTTSKLYYVAVNAYTNTGTTLDTTIKCTGNPQGLGNWANCGANSNYVINIAIAPTASIDFVNKQTVAITGQEIQFSANVADSLGRLGFGPTNLLGGVYVKPVDNSADWVSIKDITLNDCGNNRYNCSINVKWTPTTNKQYIVAVNAYTNTSTVLDTTVKCTGNPEIPASWIACGTRSNLLLNVYLPTGRIAPKANIDGNKTATVNQAITFTGNASSTEGLLGLNSGGKIILAGVYVKPVDNSADWLTIKEVLPTNCNDRFNCNFTATWTPTLAKKYYVAVNAYTFTNTDLNTTLKCTGNPQFTTFGTNNWYDCGSADNFIVDVSPVSLSPTPTVPPTNTPTPMPTPMYISDLNWTSATVGFSVPTKDKNINNSTDKTIRINNVPYTKGLVAHANSDIRYNIGGQFTTFTAKLGIEDQGSNTNLGSVIFQVWGDGVKLYESPKILGNTPTVAASVNITGVKELRLVTTDAGDGISYDVSTWADAKLTR